MAINLLDLLSNAVTPDIVQGLSRSVGESDSAVRSGVSSLLPMLLGGLANKSATPTGASSVLSMLTGSNVDSGLLGTMGNLLGSGQTGSLMQVGTTLLSGLFGSDKVAGLGSALATVSGVKASSAGSLASLIVPLAFAALKKLIGDQRMDAGGLASLLGGQRDHLAGKLDPRLTSALGLGAPATLLAGLGGMASSVTGAAAGAVAGAAGMAASATNTAKAGAAAVGSTATAAASHVTSAASGATAAASGGIGRWLPWIIGAALLAWLLPQLTQCGAKKEAPAVAAAPVVAPKAVETPAPAAVVAAAPAVVAAATPAAAATAVTWPVKVYFDTGKATTGDTGQVGIKAVAEYLVANKAAVVAITGYTDKTGNADANSKLAKDRAVGVRDALKAGGVDEARIMMKPPVFVEAGKDGSDAESRRVDLTLQ
jgi:outer membrane protein OmpA-like peptidoglycan-associated protein